MEFIPLIKGTPDWHEKYNQDVGCLWEEMDAARSGGILNLYMHAKEGTSHTLAGEGTIVRFTAAAGWAEGDTISVNGVDKKPVTLEGKPLPAGAFGEGTQIVAVVDGDRLQFLTQSYTEQFADISAQISNKAAWIEYQEGTFDFDNPGKGYGFYHLDHNKTTNWVGLPPGLEKPAGKGDGLLIYSCGSHSKWEQQLLISQHFGLLYRSSSHAPDDTKLWSRWSQIAVAAPSEKYTPSMSEKFDCHNSYYFKDQFGMLHITAKIFCKNADERINRDDTLFVLPEGFRPFTNGMYKFEIPAVYFSGFASGLVDITPATGVVRAVMENPATSCFFQCILPTE